MPHFSPPLREVGLPNAETEAREFPETGCPKLSLQPLLPPPPLKDMLRRSDSGTKGPLSPGPKPDTLIPNHLYV